MSKIALLLSGYHTEPDRDRTRRELLRVLAPIVGPVEITFNGRVGDKQSALSSTVPPEKARDFAAAVKGVTGQPTPVTLSYTY